MTFKMTAAITIAVCTAQASLADGPYYGVGLAFYGAQSDAPVGSFAPSEDYYAALGGTVGYRWDRSGNFIGAEADLDLAIGSDFENTNGATCSDGATAPYYCEHQATLRLRGIIGAPLGGMEGFASLGFAAMQGEGAISGSDTDRGVNTGYTVGFGMQSQMANGTIRYELIYDNLENTSTKSGGVEEPDFESISLKATYLFN